MNAQLKQQMAMANCVAESLSLYLSQMHDTLFAQDQVQGMDYAIAYYTPERAMDCYNRLVANATKPKNKLSLPRPEVEFRKTKMEALTLFAQKEYAAISWRHSSDIVLMF